MPESLNYKELARRYGFEAPPESAVRLTQLVAQQDSNLDQIAKVIESDAGLKARLLRAANPVAPDPKFYDITSVDEALMRSGIGCALLLAMSTPLTLALVKTFNTMLQLKLEAVNQRAVDRFGEHVLGLVKFSGKAQGEVYFHLSSRDAASVASRVLGISPAELDDAAIKDAVGELLNIATGNFKSNLSDAGLDCKLTPPQVRRTANYHMDAIPGGSLERMALKAGNIVVFVDISVNPWSNA